MSCWGFSMDVFFFHVQITSRTNGPYVCIWDSCTGTENSLLEVARIQFEKEDRGILSLSFSPNGKKLVCIAMDNSHTVYVFDWRKGEKLSESKGFTGEPPQVKDCTFVSPKMFYPVTCCNTNRTWVPTLQGLILTYFPSAQSLCALILLKK